MAHAVPFAVFVLLCAVQLGVSQKTSTTPPVTKDKDRHGCERLTCPCTGGMPGIPGIPGSYGVRGDRGDRGEQGRPGEKGNTGLRGIKGDGGPKGPPGEKGDRGSRGQNGSPGKTGPDGKTGNKGEEGSPGAKGDARGKGEKGDAAASGPISAANWKQCVWKNMNNGLDSGKLKDCSFNKLQDNTALKVSFQGNIRMVGDAKCNRWYFKFNGNECSGPMTIDAVVYNDWPSGSPNLHHHRSFEGFCENLARGTVTVELWVGSCPSGHSQGDAYTGWYSVSRIMVEEVPRSQ